ncbi:MAG: hypothetical protein SF187_01395 [Deltaproteobacteria bacterium]|nr:hypothetical protein [Deltaproteobacteria bacterium]
MPPHDPLNNEEQPPRRPLSVALRFVAVLMIAGALAGGVVTMLRYGIRAPLLRADRGVDDATLVPSEESEEADRDPSSETAMTILPFTPDASPQSAFPSPEDFAQLLDPADAASQAVIAEEPHQAPPQEPPTTTLENESMQTETPVKESAPKEEAEASALAIETEAVTTAQPEDDPAPEPIATAPTPAGPDYWVIPGNATRPSVYLGQGNAARPALMPGGFAQLASPPAPMFTSPPAPMFTPPPAPMFTTPPAPGLTTPPAPGFTTPPAPGLPPERMPSRSSRGRR